MSPYRLSICVMSHPSRADRAAGLAREVADGSPDGSEADIDVVVDPEPHGRPTAFRTTMAAWSSAPAWATHRLVLHDDMLPAAGFLARARQAVDEFPAAALALFSFWNSRNGAAARLGGLAGYRWVHAMREYMPCTALILPVDVAKGYVAFARAAGDAWAEDVLMYRYLRSAAVPSYVSTLSLAQHEAMLASVSGNDFQGLRRASWFAPDPVSLPSTPLGLAPRFSAVPFFKRGADRCALRVPDGSGYGWEEIDGSTFLARRGRGAIAAHTCERLPGASAARVPPEALRSAWRTAYGMGVVCADDPELRPQVADRWKDTKQVLETLYPGGMCDQLGDADPSSTSFLVERAFEAGFTSDAAASASTARGGRAATGSVLLTNSGGFPGEHLLRSLTDLGHQVITAGAPGERRGGRARVEPAAMVEAGTLEAGGTGTGVPVAVRIIRHHPAGAGREDHLCEIRAGDVYGPGMPSDNRLAEMVLRALMNQPIELTSPAAEPVSLVHISELAREVSDALSSDGGHRGRVLAGDESLGVGALLHSIRRVVRPVPVRYGDSPPDISPPPADPARQTLDQRIHELAQWLAYQADSPLSVTALDSLAAGPE